MTKGELLQAVIRNFDLLSTLLEGLSSSKAAVRYGCGRVLMDFSGEYPDVLYPYMDTFIDLLDSRYRILVWNAMAILANLTTVDTAKKFDAIFHRYFAFIDDAYMVTVANVVRHSRKIAVAKPHLIPAITRALLRIETIAITPHLSEECKRVITEHAMRSFDAFFDGIPPHQQQDVVAFVTRHADSPRKALRGAAGMFLKNRR
jgi:hypothetical protein